MKKTFYTLLMLLLCGAQTISAENTDASGDGNNDNTEQTGGDGDTSGEDGGTTSETTAQYIKYKLITKGAFPESLEGNSAFRGVFYADKDNTYKSGVNNSLDSQKRWTIQTTGAYIQCVSTTPFAQGDVITIAATPKKKSSKGLICRYDKSSTDEQKLTIKCKDGNEAGEQLVLKGTIDENSGLIGKYSFYLLGGDFGKYPYVFDSITVTSAFPEAQTVTISDKMEYATYSNPTYSVDFTYSGAKAYIVKQGENSDKITFTEVTKVPANTGVLLMSEKGKEVTIKATNDTEDDVTGNLLVADSEDNQTAPTGAYLLSIHNDQAAFFKSNENRTLTKGKAHLQFPENVSVSTTAFYIGEIMNPTAIDAVQAETVEAEADATAVIYNLSGQKVDSNYKGIVIKNGKKYLQK